MSLENWRWAPMAGMDKWFPFEKGSRDADHSTNWGEVVIREAINDSPHYLPPHFALFSDDRYDGSRKLGSEKLKALVQLSGQWGSIRSCHIQYGSDTDVSSSIAACERETGSIELRVYRNSTVVILSWLSMQISLATTGVWASLRILRPFYSLNGPNLSSFGPLGHPRPLLITSAIKESAINFDKGPRLNIGFGDMRKIVYPCQCCALSAMCLMISYSNWH